MPNSNSWASAHTSWAYKYPISNCYCLFTSRNACTSVYLALSLFFVCILVVISCRQLQQIGNEKNHYYPDGVYKINPTGSREILAYCDMSRDGGGWTLLVASHTNSWTANNVILRNANSPQLHSDHSILQFADSIKDNINVGGSKFEYRLEAQSRGNLHFRLFNYCSLFSIKLSK